MAKTKRCPLCYGYKTINVWEEVERDETSVTCEKREKTCPTCNGNGEVPITNADRIRAMSDEELAIWIETTATVCECCSKLDDCVAPPSCDKCVANITEWLKQPAEEVDDD